MCRLHVREKISFCIDEEKSVKPRVFMRGMPQSFCSCCWWSHLLQCMQRMFFVAYVTTKHSRVLHVHQFFVIVLIFLVAKKPITESLIHAGFVIFIFVIVVLIGVKPVKICNVQHVYVRRRNIRHKKR